MAIILPVKMFVNDSHGPYNKLDVLLIPLGNCDMVLGILWLSNLDTVSWYFKKLAMEFDYGGYHHVLKGEMPQKMISILGQMTEKLMVHSIQLYFLQLFPPVVKIQEL